MASNSSPSTCRLGSDPDPSQFSFLVPFRSLHGRQGNSAAVSLPPPLCLLTVTLQVNANSWPGRLSSSKRIDDSPASRTPIGAGFSFWSMTGWWERAMKFTVTVRAGVAEVVERYASARAALEHDRPAFAAPHGESGHSRSETSRLHDPGRQECSRTIGLPTGH